MLRIDDDVVQDARRPTERHVVVSLDRGVRVADHVPVVVGDEDGGVRVFELRAQEGRVVRRRPLLGGQEAPRVEVVMLLDEERAEAADPRQVGGGRAPDDDVAHVRRSAIYIARAGCGSKARDVERFRWASICAFRSATFCSAVAMASAPAIKRRGGGSWLAMMMSARASFARTAASASARLVASSLTASRSSD